MLELLKQFRFKLADLIFRPRYFIFGHHFEQAPDYCERCQNIFCRHSWTGLELKEKYYRFKTRKDLPPF